MITRIRTAFNPTMGDDQQKQRSGISKTIRLIIGIVVVAFLIWKTDLTQVISALARTDPTWLLMAFLVQIIGKFVWAWRWSKLLEVFQIPSTFFRTMKGVYVGLFFGNFLPTGFGGDFYRGYWVIEDKQLYGKSMFVIFIERLIGMATLGYVAIPAFIWLLLTGLDFGTTRLFLLALLLGLCGVVFLLHPAVFAFADSLLTRLSIRAGSAQRKKVRSALERLHAAGDERIGIYILSIVTQLVGIFFFYCLGQGLDLPLSIWHYFVIVPLTVVATLLPITFNGLGVREGALIALTTALASGVTPAEAVALGLSVTIVNLLVSLIGGGFYVVGYRTKTAVA